MVEMPLQKLDFIFNQKFWLKPIRATQTFTEMFLINFQTSFYKYETGYCIETNKHFVYKFL